MLIKQICQMSMIFVAVGISKILVSSMSLIFAIVYVKGNAYRINFWYMSKNDAINIMNGSNLVDKRGVL